MSRKKKIFLPFYMECMKNGLKMKWQGLCGNFDGLNCEDGMKILKLFYPTLEDIEELKKEGLNRDYWASGLPYFGSFLDDLYYSFTTSRQTFCLFMAAINNEL